MEGRSLSTRPSSALPGRPESQTNLADILERVLDKGIVIAGDIQINLLDIELLTIKLRLLIASVDRAREMGINWWESDPTLQRVEPGDGDAGRLERENRELRERLERLERRIEAGRRRVADDLARWAAERAPDLLRRAEDEAVRVIRDALVRVAIGERAERATPAPAATPERAAQPREPAREASGSLLWAYCIVEAGAAVPGDLASVDTAGPVERIEADGLAALVSRVPAVEFGAEPLRANLNDLGWLERVARAHEAVLEQVLARAAVVPLRICTLYESEESVEAMLARERDAFASALAHLAGRQEWGVKLLADPERIAAAARARSTEVKAYEDDLADRTGGGAYMLRRRLERHVRELSDTVAAEVADDVHERLREWASDAVTRPPQNRDLSGHEGDMLLNAAYLVEDERVEGLRRVVAELEERHREVGVRLELTGPWPPYNFVPGQGAGVLA